jgi:hypothetical protein
MAPFLHGNRGRERVREIVSSIGVKDSEREREGFEGGEVGELGLKGGFWAMWW